MNKKGKYLAFIALVVITGLVIPGCLSEPGASDSLADIMSGGGSTPQARAAGGSAPARTQARAAASSTARGGSSTAQAAAASSPARAVEAKIIAAEQKALSEFSGFFEKNWVSLIIILIICILCTIICLKIKRKTKNALLKRAIVVAASLGLIFGVSYFGMMKNDGNFHALGWEQFFKRDAVKHGEAKTLYAYVNSYRLNFRAGPSISNRIVRVLRKDMRIEVIDSSGLWWKVRYDNIEGYVNSRYLRK